jgi:mannose-6-phosphate isomerase-like protein (cupin superfamily)
MPRDRIRNPKFLGLRRRLFRRQDRGDDETEGGAMNGFTTRRIDELGSINHGAVKLAADELGVKTFGLQVLDLPGGFTDYPEHDHAHDGQEEVYIVLEGAADFLVAGERIHADAGTMLRVEPAARRKLVPGAFGVRVVAIGCSPDGYERPQAFRQAGRG